MSDATADFWAWALDQRRQTDSLLELHLVNQLGEAGAIAWMEAHPYPDLPYIDDPEVP